MKEFLSYLTSIFGTIMSLAYFVQAYRIWKTKDSQAISIIQFIIFALGTMIWTLYGIVQEDWVIVIAFGVGVIGVWTVLGFTFKYRK